MKNHYKLWIILSFIIVFILGGLAGVLLDRHILPSKAKKSRRDRRPVEFPTLDIMAKELGLSAEQQKQIRQIFADNEESLQGLRSHIHERISTIRSELITEIKNVLTEEQRTKFEAMIERYLQQRKEQMEKRRNHRKPRENSNE